MNTGQSVDSLLEVLTFYLLSDMVLMPESGGNKMGLVKRWKSGERDCIYEYLQQTLSDLSFAFKPDESEKNQDKEALEAEKLGRPCLRLPARVDAAIIIVEIWAEQLVLRAWVNNDSYDILPVCVFCCPNTSGPAPIIAGLQEIIGGISEKLALQNS